ncbi:MAG TPA: DUF4296 domain-containing protein [Chitinophagales bacterium]
MKKLGLLLLLTLSFFSCRQNIDKPKKPAVFLEQKAMGNLLTEIHLSDAIAQEKANGNLDLEKNLSQQGLNQILQNHKLRKTSFDSLYAYYIKQPELMNEMYQHIITNLSKKQAELTH